MPLARVYSPFFPYPATEGAYQVILDQARSIAALGWEVELVCWLDGVDRLRARATRAAGLGELEFPRGVEAVHLGPSGPRRCEVRTA